MTRAVLSKGTRSDERDRASFEAAGLGMGLALLSARIYRGANRYHRDSVVVQDIDLGALADRTSLDAGREFVERYIERFGGLATMYPVPALPPAFVERLRANEAVSFVEMLFQATLALEAAMAFARRCLHAVAYSEILPGPAPERAAYVWSSDLPELSQDAARVAFIGFANLLPDELTWPSTTEPEDFSLVFRELMKQARKYRPLPPAAVLLDAAYRRNIPFHIVGGNVIQLGEGRFQHRIWSTVTSTTSRVADRLCRDKYATSRLLADLDLPVPPQRLVSSAKEARAAAEDIGFPVVVKPLGGNTGKGVSANLKATAEVAGAFRRARQIGSEVIVERFVEGQDHRILVVGGRVAAAALRVPPSVTGDGRRTIGELIDLLNGDPLRDGFRRCQVKLDEELSRLLERAGYELATVLPQGEVFQLRSTANVSMGGSTIDVTEELHPDNAEMAIYAVEAVGLDVAGVDFLTTDISRSYRDVGGGIVEINSRPGLRPHIWPVTGQSRDVAAAVLDTMYPPGARSRVPLALAIGSPDASRALAERTRSLLEGAGITSCALPRKTATQGQDSLAQDISRPVRDPRMEACVCARPFRDIGENGLAFSSYDSAAILDPSDSETMQAVSDILLRADGGTIVLSADGDLPEAVLSRAGTERLFLVSGSARNPLLKDHLGKGGAGLFVRGKGAKITIAAANLPSADGSSPQTIAKLPASTAPHLIEEIMLAVALTLNMSLPESDLHSAFKKTPWDSLCADHADD